MYFCLFVSLILLSTFDRGGSTVSVVGGGRDKLTVPDGHCSLKRITNLSVVYILSLLHTFYPSQTI